LGDLLFLLPFRRRQVEAQVRFLHHKPEGRLLDVGCGSGEWLLAMRDLGWEVEGVDFDGDAVQAAAEQGVLVRRGVLEDQHYPAGSFDAVTLNHVIEHVPDPLATLRECARVLRPGGDLVLFTPNNGSLGHRVFGCHWRGLEPPRHLHVFCPESMSALLRAAGFTRYEVSTLNSDYIWRKSAALWAGRGSPQAGLRETFSSRTLAGLLNLLEHVWLAMDGSAGECLYARAKG
jgi:SAM-dependent methyltransferase